MELNHDPEKGENDRLDKRNERKVSRELKVKKVLKSHKNLIEIYLCRLTFFLFLSFFHCLNQKEKLHKASKPSPENLKATYIRQENLISRRFVSSLRK